MGNSFGFRIASTKGGINMAWLETRVMDERFRFVNDVMEDTYNITELCRMYNISRKTGYKWLGRYDECGVDGLKDLPRAPHNHPNALPDIIRTAILEIKTKFPYWGPAKIDYRLRKVHPGWQHYPALSTIGQLLKRKGLVFAHRYRHATSPTQGVLTVGSHANDVWCADFKGHFKTKDLNRCNPLTVTDNFSRYILCCRHLEKMSYTLVKEQFERVFKSFGLPLVIRTDNGQPFSSYGLCGLSRLNAWWIKLGIYPERIEPGKPEQNGRHERMHRTLKEETASPPAANTTLQQKRFDQFIWDYNELRPHQAINMLTPTMLYERSVRKFPSKTPQPCYPRKMKVFKVHPKGELRHNGRIYLSEALGGEYIGLEMIDNDKSTIWFYDYKLGTLDHRTNGVEPASCYPFSAGVNPCPDERKLAKVLPMCPV
jgi:transposase InsO family protein